MTQKYNTQTPINTTFSLIEQLENEKNKKIDSITRELEENQNQITELQKQKKKAQDELNAETFTKIESDINILNTKRKMLNNELKKNNDNILIQPEKAIEIENEIRKFVDNKNSEHIAEARELLNKLEQLYSENNQLLNDSENAIRKLQTMYPSRQNSWFPQYEIKGENLRGYLNILKELEVYKLILNYKK